MGLLVSLLKRRDIIERIVIERLTEPLHLNIFSALVAVFGSTRAKIKFDLLVRQQHAFGLLHAADAARRRGLSRVTVVELGVGSGTGLLNLCTLSQRITDLTQIQFDIVGFDTGQGMPPPKDYRDHPELYREGWFPMDSDRIRESLPDNARLVLGDLKETMPKFVDQTSTESPLGFATLDVDYHSSSKDALGLFMGQASCYLPVLPIYVDDVALETHNPFCGEQLALTEFNQEQRFRKIVVDPFLPHSRVFKHAEWLGHMYKLHVLDHPDRNDLNKPDSIIKVSNPYLSAT